jgi:hypothetical protein
MRVLKQQSITTFLNIIILYADIRGHEMHYCGQITLSHRRVLSLFLHFTNIAYDVVMYLFYVNFCALDFYNLETLYVTHEANKINGCD